MAAGNWYWFGAGLRAALKGDLDLDAGVRMVLVTASYTPDQETHDTWADASANEVAAGGGYSTHGKLANGVVGGTGLVANLDVDDLTWSAATLTAKYALLVRDADANGALASTDLLIGYLDLNEGGAGSVSPVAGDLVISANVAGALRITAAEDTA